MEVAVKIVVVLVVMCPNLVVCWHFRGSWHLCH